MNNGWPIPLPEGAEKQKSKKYLREVKMYYSLLSEECVQAWAEVEFFFVNE